MVYLLFLAGSLSISRLRAANSVGHAIRRTLDTVPTFGPLDVQALVEQVDEGATFHGLQTAPFHESVSTRAKTLTDEASQGMSNAIHLREEQHLAAYASRRQAEHVADVARQQELRESEVALRASVGVDGETDFLTAVANASAAHVDARTRHTWAKATKDEAAAKRVRDVADTDLATATAKQSGILAKESERATQQEERLILTARALEQRADEAALASSEATDSAAVARISASRRSGTGSQAIRDMANRALSQARVEGQASQNRLQEIERNIAVADENAVLELRDMFEALEPSVEDT